MFLKNHAEKSKNFTYRSWIMQKIGHKTNWWCWAKTLILLITSQLVFLICTVAQNLKITGMIVL